MGKNDIGAAEVEEMRLVTQRGVGDAPLPVKYEAAKAALAAAASVDECSTWAKKAAALASYARQSEDESLEKMAMKIRARAIRRCGDLLGEIPARAHGGAGATPHLRQTSDRAAAARDAGLSRDQQTQALQVARIPAREFEAAVESDDPPTITELAERGTKPKPKPLVDIQGRDPDDFNRSLLLNGAMRSLAETIRSVTPEEHVRGCVPRDYAPMSEDAACLSKWLTKLLTLTETLE